MTDIEWVEAELDRFKKRTTGGGLWKSLSRDKVADGALERVKDPDKIAQKDSNLCGPSCFIHSYIKDHPRFYVNAIIDLFESGRALLGDSLYIRPSTDLMNYTLPATATINQADWILLASLRNTTSWFLKYASINGVNVPLLGELQPSAMTLPHEMVRWFKQVGYLDVQEETNLTSTKGLSNLEDASQLFAKGYKVCLLINEQVLGTATQDDGSFTPNHWVVLASQLAFEQYNHYEQVPKQCFHAYHGEPAYCEPAHMVTSSIKYVSMKVWTWGAERNVPLSADKPLLIQSFLKNYFGYIACKY